MSDPKEQSEEVVGQAEEQTANPDAVLEEQAAEEASEEVEVEEDLDDSAEDGEEEDEVDIEEEGDAA